jgi:hypothetical protein
MAACMDSFMASIISPVTCVVNREDETVWGLIKELRWAFERSDTNDRIMVVISRQAAFRVRLISRMFFHRHVTIITCEDTPWWHEIFGYAKVMAYAMGLGEVAENFRRRYYREW